ncbi:acyclic terpene utilization AtuA family protein [Jannaschia sp. Os4]|uniref:acyclic terpene utilization AtuA family protein n=1 Tax=Jannaschia sp. Os4 TaxID=2807617 RepID=UPI00193ACC80|nr:acyclic terpene utilization AtuA family protein [Jannaschia sp. Os4]MBM2576992.1 acyclic terpene utilization AtuA family protein [Jannaschia sp. Os4]
MSIRVLVPAGALGLGWDDEALARGVARGPDLIAIDGGSTDSGPSYLGRGVSKYSRAQIKGEWAALIDAARQADCPLILGTAGTCGAGRAVDWMLDITRQILAETGRSARIAVLRCDRDPTALAEAWDRVTPLPGAPEVTPDELAACSNLVALAGVEQVQEALATGADIVICGRTTDTAILAALPLAAGCDAGCAWLGAKVGECGALATTRPWSGVLELDFDAAGCTVRPLAEGAEATPQTVAAHLLYENADPHILHEPGGHLDCRPARYAADGEATRIEGAVWVPGPYSVKLEAARLTGFGAQALAIVRPPRYVRHARAFAASLEAEARRRIADRLPDVAYDMDLRLIGVDAALGDLEPDRGAPVEVGLLLRVRAATQEQALEVARIVNPLLLHHPLEPGEPMPTFAFPSSPPEHATGATYAFVLHHVLALDDPMDGFSVEAFDA